VPNRTLPRDLSTQPVADIFGAVQERFRDAFELQELIAASEFRILFMARDPVLKRRVGLRVHTQPNSRHRTWFERETELLAALDHPSMRAVYSAGDCDDWAYRITKWIDGENLLEAARRGPRPIPEVLQLARHLIDVLEYAHSQHIVIRRIIPANVMIDRSGRAVITDLRFANRCLAYADPDPDPSAEAFLAPETWHGHVGEPASDIYAAGAILYFAVTGTPPASDPGMIQPPKSLRDACPQTLQRVIMRALQLDPRDRYFTAHDMAEDLLSELGEASTPAREPQLSRPADNPVAWEKQLRRALGDEYELLEELGVGGFGSVYLVRDLRLEREVALKVLHPYLTAEPAVVERFRKEAQLAAQLHHPNIVGIFDIGSRGGLLWYTMAYVAGASLGATVRWDGPLPIMRVMALLGEALDALGHAHAHGVVHRDIKPENVLIRRGDGSVQITDFGLAMALQDEFGGASSRSGTPEYAAPEQLLGEQIDVRTDLYSLALVAFFALTGKSPFGGGTVEAILARQTTQGAPPVSDFRDDVPDPIVQVLQKGAARYPADRYASAEEFETAMRDAITGWRGRPSTWFRRFVPGGTSGGKGGSARGDLPASDA
jgi:serine/threonine-protein kinase